ncbi:CoA-binding domain protein [Denitrovibrio acetiphilus DSM 12809]|uniref:CoA-binding domain protein n=1 Tax=Denitrovibrio acetiphilus (strain DSM 12809 / NBRC 114555 / N2460) TaxID=522772 RepID=D4H6Z8_DENA2|nr:CoA-binding protein [Denitrovibrio acetiphilus]ADD67864.1 CoA-binding domain protein [Denitrovibrio acetiphilus DSM 12809]
MQNLSDDKLRELIKNAKTIVIVGASNKPERASNGIMKFLIKNGYDVTPVNPIEKEVLGIPTYDSVEDVPFEPDVVDVFRQSAYAPEIVRAAAGKNAKLIWLQEGVESVEAAQIANVAEIPFVQDKCIFKEYLRLGLAGDK